MKLATKRLILRPFTRDDYTSVHRYSTKAKVVRFMDWGPNSPEETANFINIVLMRNAETPRLSYDFIVTLKTTSEVIGACGIYFDEDNTKPPTLGWVFDDTYWGNGYATEVAARLLAFAFNNLNVRVITASAVADNIASWKIMEKIGMRYANKSKITVKGSTYDYVMYELTKLEYTLLNHKTYL